MPLTWTNVGILKVVDPSDSWWPRGLNHFGITNYPMTPNLGPLAFNRKALSVKHSVAAAVSSSSTSKGGRKERQGEQEANGIVIKCPSEAEDSSR